MPRVSVGMPVYNGEKFVADAIASILSQSFTAFELIISDNGSTDGTERICRGYAESDRRVSYYRSPVNRGAAWNYNRVFELSSAPYFKWAAHDDICAPEYLERCVEALDRNRTAVLAYPKNRIIDEEGRLVGEYPDGFDLRSPRASDRLLQCLASTGRCNPIFGLIRADALRKTQLVGNYIASDYILLAELALIGEFCELPQYLFFNRDHPYRSGRALRNLREHAAWYDPARRRGAPKRWWRLMIEYCRSIARAPLGARERMRCYWIWIRWTRWNWASLAAELHVPAKGRAVGNS